MAEKIYGVDLAEKVTAIMARDAMILCFTKAHDEVLEDLKTFTKFKSEKEFNKIKQININALIKKFFDEVGGDFEKPTKKNILDVLDKLKEYSVNFRSPKIVKRHADRLMKIIGRIDS